MSNLPPPPPPPPYGQPAVAPGEQNKKALWSMVLGVAGLFCAGLLVRVAIAS